MTVNSGDKNNWREKYLNALDEQEQLEKKFARHQELLRSALVRVSIAADGQDEALDKIKPGPLDVKLKFSVADGNKFGLRYQGNEILNLPSTDFHPGENEMEILIDKTVAEIFINKGEYYLVRQLPPARNDHSLEFDSERYGPFLNSLQVYEMKSIWKNDQ